MQGLHYYMLLPGKSKATTFNKNEENPTMSSTLGIEIPSATLILGDQINLPY